MNNDKLNIITNMFKTQYFVILFMDLIILLLGMYVVSTKPRFSIEVTNNDPTMVMAGIRINVGGQDIGRAPGYIEVLGRTLHLLPINRSRWFDFPLTREESLQSDKKLIIVFGPSRDPEAVTMIDSIKLLV